MGTVGVHLNDDVVVTTQGPLETLLIGGAQALLGRPVQDVHVVITFGDAVGKLTGAVRTRIVDNEYLRIRCEPAYPIMDSCEIVAFIVGRNHDQHLRELCGLRLCHCHTVYVPRRRLRPARNTAAITAAPPTTVA